MAAESDKLKEQIDAFEIEIKRKDEYISQAIAERVKAEQKAISTVKLNSHMSNLTAAQDRVDKKYTITFHSWEEREQAIKAEIVCLDAFFVEIF